MNVCEKKYFNPLCQYTERIYYSTQVDPLGISMLGKVKLKIQDKQTLNLKEENTMAKKMQEDKKAIMTYQFILYIYKNR